MSEYINAEKKKQNYQKPPLSSKRVVLEIPAGASTALFLLLLLYFYVIVCCRKDDPYVAFGVMVILFFLFPPLYVLGSAVVIYRIGCMGNETGSFLLTLAGGFIGGLIMYLIIPLRLFLGSDLSVGVLLLLSPAILATYGFNLKRRYKKSPILKS